MALQKFIRGLSLAIAASALCAATAVPSMADRETVRRASSWAYQLQGNNADLRRSNADVAVVDPDHAGSATRYKTKANGGTRAVLAYISVGEAEVGRSYMKGSRQTWNTGRTQGWSGNYATRYWEEDWRRIVKTRVRNAMAAGYDGVYLDRVDTHETVRAPGGSKAAMVRLVEEVAGEARGRKGNAAVIVQNGEELLSDKRYRAAIDGIAKEDLYHGISHRGDRNRKSDVDTSRRYLKAAQADGKKVFVVEYLGGATGKRVADEARRDGFVPLTGVSRQLNRSKE